MSTTRKKNIRIRRKKPSLDASNVVVVTHTTEKDTLVPEKLKKANEMLSKSKMMNSWFSMAFAACAARCRQGPHRIFRRPPPSSSRPGEDPFSPENNKWRIPRHSQGKRSGDTRTTARTASTKCSSEPFNSWNNSFGPDPGNSFASNKWHPFHRCINASVTSLW